MYINPWGLSVMQSSGQDSFCIPGSFSSVSARPPEVRMVWLETCVRVDSGLYLRPLQLRRACKYAHCGVPVRKFTQSVCTSTHYSDQRVEKAEFSGRFEVATGSPGAGERVAWYQNHFCNTPWVGCSSRKVETHLSPSLCTADWASKHIPNRRTNDRSVFIGRSPKENLL